ncbi:NIF-domain-containing protein [Neolentinus lepideus HHB14362 ss-1]|uniref:NIF-domain-containing protein n=1 Tax=Neolentinus lepideus HHB14362 ss-1 TaxID=1314782 RepID=A0A165V8N6_9AGAM|nr:NIF-domain-containing protein [Neolentinus lepideus HHB14362 ss-1]
MNSLTYLSRQFDVLASPKAPGATEHRRGSEGSLARVQTSLSLSDSSRRTPSPLRRSASSPSGLSDAISIKQSIHQPVTYLGGRIEPRMEKIFFVRIFWVFWDAICTAWSTVSSRGRVEEISAVKVDRLRGLTEEESKESRDEKYVLLHQGSPPSPPQSPDSLLPSLSALGHPRLFPVDRISSDKSTLADDLTSASSHLKVPSREPTPVSTSASSEASQPPSLRQQPVARKTPLHLPKTLVLDLDETLIHSTSRPMYGTGANSWGWFGFSGLFGRKDKGAGKIVEVVLGGRSTLYHVYKRPFVDYFLRKVSGWYTLVIFTASMQEYADPVIDWLDAGRGILARRLFRESCTQLPNGSYSKDLSMVEQDLARVFLVDNSPISYSINEANGVPIEGWIDDPHDEALLDLLPVLDSLRFTSDVRRVLGIRGFS